MTTKTIESISTYTNWGSACEQNLVYALTGKIRPHDSVPFDKGSDCDEFSMSIKSSRFTLASGKYFTSTTFEGQLDEYFSRVHSTCVAYVAKNNVAYIMDMTEFREFITTFGYLTRDSQKNGGQNKIRCKSESKEMMAYFMARI